MPAVTAVPAVMIEVDGVRTDPVRHGNLGSVLIRQRLSMPSVCELTFIDPPGRAGRSNLVELGAALKVTAEGMNQSLFEGEVTATEHRFESTRGHQLRVRGYDLLYRLRRHQATRVFDSMNCSGLAGELVAEVGLQVEAGADGPVWNRIVQWGQSDLDLLKEVCDRSGLFFVLHPPALQIFSLEGCASRVPLKLAESLLEARVEINGDPSCRSVRTLGWDLGRVEGRRGTAASPRRGRHITSELAPEPLGGTDERLILNEVWAEDSQADAAAQDELDRRAANEVVLSGVAAGSPDLMPGVVVAVEGLDVAFDGEYVLTEVTHQIDARKGYLSEMTTAVAPRPPRPKGTTMVIGVVTNLDDPEGLGRLRAALPSLGGIETGWLGVVTAGAGVGKGLVALPDVDDQVLILFAREDLTQGVVLGGLFGVKSPPDWGLQEGQVRRYTLQTPAGQKVVLDDSGSRIRLEDQAGNYFELSPEKVLLHAMTELEIRSPGNPIVIRGSSVDFRRA